MVETSATFTRGSVSRHVLEMVGTSALGLLALFLTDILTLTYVSLLHDELLLATVGVAKTLLFINAVVVTGIVIAAGSLISLRSGAGRWASIGALNTHSLILAAAVSTALSLVEWYKLDYFIDWLGDAATTTPQARQFVCLALVSSILLAVTQTSAQALRAVGHSRRALGVVLSAAATLAIVDPILIFVLELGLLGAGIASVIAGVVSCAIGLHQTGRHVGLTRRIRLRLFKLYGARIAKITLPYTLGNLAMPVALTFTLSQLALFGVSAMAGMALMDRILQITYCLYFALPSALIPIFVQHLGARQHARGQAALRCGVKLVIGYGLAAWCVLYFAAPLIGQAFSLSEQAQALLVDLCRFGPGLWIMIGLDFIAISVFITLDRAWWITFYAWMRGTIGTIPFVLFGAEHFGASGVVLGMWLGYALVALASIGTAVGAARRHPLYRAQVY